MDRKANAAFYSDPGMTPEEIFVSSPNIAPPIANTFVQILTRQTSRLPTQPGMSTGGAAPDVAPEPKSEVRTYGIPAPGDERPTDPDHND